ncbi:22453_t:CDS:2 [Cetraspora pellucida]|uniref:22453_t:CDS:1 n=1 Tax=Cetraspora pellucida TaxID=1433469 RepID=A0A9N8YXJ8_9GLOM|nr:22453_t:CDS:2 [Cetraspora pellucida]
MTIDEFYRKLLQIGRRANYRPKELHNKFLDAFPIPWLEKAKDISEYLLLDELAKKLYEIELQQIARHKRDRIPDLLPRGPPPSLQTEEDDNENEEGGYNNKENKWHAPSQSEKKNRYW